MKIDLNSLSLIGQVRVNVNSLSFLEQIAVNFFLGFGLALINVLIIYFFRFVPRVISVTYWHKPGRRWTRVLIFAYLIALILQMATSPFFASAFQRVYTELAWSPFQALWTVAGVLLMDAIVFFWTKTRRGVEISKQSLQGAKAMAADKLDGISISNPLSAEARAAAEERRKQEEAAEAAEREARKQRMDDRLKDY